MIQDARRRLRNTELEDELAASSPFEQIIGASPVMWEMYSRIRRIAPHFRTVLITGPTGSGKDLVAQALHKLSPAATGNFVVVNCSAVVETLFESELFGHVKGAFTGATADKVGLVEHASGGSLFLDEIGDMPLAHKQSCCVPFRIRKFSASVRYKPAKSIFASLPPPIAICAP